MEGLMPLMYADDLAVVCSSVEEVRTAIRAVNQWAAVNNMLVNPSKSAVVQFGLNTRKPKEDTVDGIPWKMEYQYLGGVVQSNRRTTEHSKKLNGKVGWITARLTPLRKLADLRLNLNLFKVFLTPMFHQAASLIFSTEKDKARYNRHYKCALKRFMCMPRNMSDEVLKWITEDPATLLQNRVVVTVGRTAVRQGWTKMVANIPRINHHHLPSLNDSLKHSHDCCGPCIRGDAENTRKESAEHTTQRCTARASTSEDC